MDKKNESYLLFKDYAKGVYEKIKNKESDFADGGFLIPETISVPINKWENFKQRYSPCWLKKIFPVKTKEVNFCEMLIKVATKKGYIKKSGGE